MARPPRFNISVLSDLLTQLRYAPADTIARQMHAGQALLDEIEPERNYPEDFIVYRIIGFRMQTESAAILMGEALVPDLARFIEQLSKRLNWPTERYADQRVLTIEQVMARMGVSTVTLHRYRKKGLVAYRAVDEDGHGTFVFLESAIERFENRHRDRVTKARKFSRMSEPMRAELVEQARRMAGEQPITLNAAAGRMAREIGRSHDAIRQLLINYDRSHPESAIFNETGPLTLKQRRFLLRAFDRGLPAADLARRVGRSTSTVYRAVAEGRAERIREWSWRYVRLATFDHADADEVILGVACVRSELPKALVTDAALSTWIDPGLDTPAEVISENLPRIVAARNLLLCRADQRRMKLPVRQPAASEIDEIETALRWATRLKRLLLDYLRPALRSTLELHLNRRLGEAPSREAVALYILAIQCAISAIDQFDPDRQPDLTAVVVHGLRAALATRSDVLGRSTARARSDPSTIALPDLQSHLAPWMGVLEWPELDEPGPGDLDEWAAQLLTCRFGLDGRSPQTQVHIAQHLGQRVHRIVAAEQRARRTLRQQRRTRR